MLLIIKYDWLCFDYTILYTFRIVEYLSLYLSCFYNQLICDSIYAQNIEDLVLQIIVFDLYAAA